jgi:glutamine synthetase
VIALDDLRGLVADGAVEEVVLALPDLAGRLQGTRVSARHFLERVAHDGFGACSYLLATDVDLQVTASSPELDPAGTGFGDMVLVPDLSTLRPLPWDPGTVQVMVDARHADGRAVQVAPREVLRAQVEALAARDLVPLAGVELEFRVFTESYGQAATSGWADLTPATRVGVDYALVGMEGMDRLTRRLRREMGRAGLRMESARGECAPGQYEIVFGYDRAMCAADQAAFYKTGAKQVAAQEGMALTFMPKYDAAEGNSCHVHLSLRDSAGDPVLAGAGVPGRPDLAGTSPVLQQVLAGQLACMPELTLLFAPTVNAYKRLRPGAFAPTTVTWGRDNRLASVRLVGSGESLRLEHRVPGGDADPYLVLAGLLLAARHGLEQGLRPPPATVGAPPADSVRLPTSLEEAALLFERSDVARKGLGDALVDALASAARAEVDAHAASVTAWERARGFELR